VRVISECRLIDERSSEQVYWRRDGKSLAPGYYVVRNPPGGPARRYNEDAVFRGPYPLRGEARAALEQLLALTDARAVSAPPPAPAPPLARSPAPRLGQR